MSAVIAWMNEPGPAWRGLLHAALRCQLDALTRELVAGQWRWPGEAQRRLGMGLEQLRQQEQEQALWPADPGASHLHLLWLAAASGDRDSVADLCFSLQAHRHECLRRLAEEALAPAAMSSAQPTAPSPAPPPRPVAATTPLTGDSDEPAGHCLE